MKRTEMIMVIEAYSEGKGIEVSLKGADHWEISNDPIWDFSRCKYRVKPAPKYKTITPASYLQQSGCIDFSAEYVEIKALEDALGLLFDVILDYDEKPIYDELKSLIK